VIRRFSSHAKAPAQAAEFSDYSDTEEAEDTGEKLPAEAGMNRFVWDLRYPPVPPIPGFTSSEYGQGLVGPQVVPGKYRARLTSGGKNQEAAIEIKLDPRVHVSDADLAAEFQLRRKIYERLVQNYTTVNQLRDVRAQVKALEKRLEGDAKQKEVAAAAEALRKKLDTLEKEFINPKLQGTQDTLSYGNGIDAKYALLGAGVESADAAPSQTEIEQFDELEKQLAGPLAQWKEFTGKDLPAFNALVQHAGLGSVFLGSGKTEEEDED
jgi:DNA-binding FrmR family transcriptional regulator